MRRALPEVVFVNRYFYPDHSATSQMLSDLAFALADVGHDVTVITSRLRYDDPGASLPAKETVKGVKVVRIWTTGFGRGNLAGRAFDYLTFYLSASVAMARHARPGRLLIAKTDPPMLSILAAPIARLRGARTINWLQDVFPEVLNAFAARPDPQNRWRLRAALMSALTWLRNRSLRASDANVVLGWRMQGLITDTGVTPERVRIIENWNRGDLIHPVAREDNPLRPAWRMGDAFVVGYSGNLGRAHDAATMQGAIQRLASRGDAVERDLDAGGRGDIRFMFIGGGALMSDLQQFVERNGLSRHVQFKPYQPRSEMACSLSLPDLHLISLRPEFEGLIVPSKIYGVMAAGRGAIFIGDPEGEVARLLRVHDCGVSVREGDDAGLARLIEDLAGDPERVARWGQNARTAFETHFNFDAAVGRWTRLIDELSDRNRD